MGENQPVWEQRFIACLRANPGVQDRFDRVLRRGMDRQIALRLLQDATVPEKSRANGRVKLSHPLQDYADKLIPSQKKATALAARLRQSAKELREFWLNAVALEKPEYFEDARKTALQLTFHADILEELPWMEIRKPLSYKEFWQHIPWAMLFAGFQPPKKLSYEDLSQFLKAGLIAHGGKSSTGEPRDPLSPRSLRQKRSRLARSGHLSRGAALLRIFFHPIVTERGIENPRIASRVVTIPSP